MEKNHKINCFKTRELCNFKNNNAINTTTKNKVEIKNKSKFRVIQIKANVKTRFLQIMMYLCCVYRVKKLLHLISIK